MPYITQRIEGYTTGIGGPQSEAGILMGNSITAAAYFQLCPDVVDLMFAEPLQQYESAIRDQVSEVCIDSLFGWCREGGDSGRCMRGAHPELSLIHI
eukprot:5574188-Alexandrium_andersonii.AAC.1